MLFNIIACVLAVFVPIAVGLALLTYVQSLRWQLERRLSDSYSEMRGTLATFSTRLHGIETVAAALESGLKQTSGAHLATEVAALGGDVEKLAASVRKQFGKVFAELHHDGTLRRNAERQSDVETPEEVRARLRLEHGLPKMGRNGAGAEE